MCPLSNYANTDPTPTAVNPKSLDKTFVIHYTQIKNKVKEIVKLKKSIVRIISAAVALCTVWACCACGKGNDDGTQSTERGIKTVTEEIILSYAEGGEEAEEKTERLFEELDGKNPVIAAKWRSILSLWKESNDSLPLHYKVLPDGLPDTDELCMVALGYQLNADGTMRDELIERLKVVKKSAKKYPHALIVCTGGPTAIADETATEAGKMAEWLVENGIDSERIIVEKRSLTTAQNARYTLGILTNQYPQVTQLAIISSDYHIATGNLVFGAESTLRAEEAGKEKYRVVANAACKVPGSLSATFQAGALIELTGDRQTAQQLYNQTDE